MKFYNRYNNLNDRFAGDSISHCCGSKWFGYDPGVYKNKGIVVWPSKEKVEENNDECWTHSIPVGNEFLVVRHRKVS